MRMPAISTLAVTLGLEVEADAAEADALDHLTFEHLVGGFHVGEPPAEQDVGQHRQETVGEPAAQRDAIAGIEEARTVDDIGAAVENRREQTAVLVRIELQIRVLDQQNLAGGECQSEPDGGTFSEIDRAVVALHARDR